MTFTQTFDLGWSAILETLKLEAWRMLGRLRKTVRVGLAAAVVWVGALTEGARPRLLRLPMRRRGSESMRSS